jgi:hypothetical protein
LQATVIDNPYMVAGLHQRPMIGDTCFILMHGTGCAEFTFRGSSKSRREYARVIRCWSKSSCRPKVVFRFIHIYSGSTVAKTELFATVSVDALHSPYLSYCNRKAEFDSCVHKLMDQGFSGN